MSTFAIALPIQPGKSEEWRRVVQELSTSKRRETDDMHKRLGVKKADWFIQQTPVGDLALVVLEGEDAGAKFAAWGGSQHPFDLWMKGALGPLYGIDFNQTPAGPLPSGVYEYRS